MNIAVPLSTLPVAFEIRPMMDRTVTVLPDPDSPTIASVWPASRLNETPSTAVTMPVPRMEGRAKTLYLEQVPGV